MLYSFTMFRRFTMSHRAASLLLLFAVAMSSYLTVPAKAHVANTTRAFLPASSLVTRETMSEAESDRIREAQEISLRIAVFNKIIERRLMALRDPQAANSKEAQKQIEKWGALPTGKPDELLSDIGQLLEEAKTNIEDAEARKVARKDLVKAVRLLNDGAARLAAALAPMRTGLIEDEKATAWLDRINESVKEIAEAAKGMTDAPAPPDKQ